VSSIDILPDDVLLAIFDNFCDGEFQHTQKRMEAWQALVHVCRRWRCVVFVSPCRLNLRLICTENTPARDTLDVWPPLPLVIQSNASLTTKGVDNILAVLERRDRVYRIELCKVNSSPLKKIFSVMQEPFPELTHLLLTSRDEIDETLPVNPGLFLGGSALRLYSLKLDGVPYPGLTKLLPTATHLVDLHLLEIPHSGYISPDAMATALSTLTNLGSLSLGFRSPESRPDPENRRPPPLTRHILPILTSFWFKGACEYLDNLVTHIDAPQVNLFITFFNQILFDTPQFIQFISRTPTLKAFEEAHVVFEDRAARINLSSQIYSYGSLEVRISCREFDWQVSSLEQVCTWCLPPLSTLENLSIYHHIVLSDPHWPGNTDNTLWLELLNPFTAVKKLYLSEELAPRIVLALQELIEGRMMAVLPTLQNILLEQLQPPGPVRHGIWQFVAMRQAIGHHIAVSPWGRFPGRGVLESPTTKGRARLACLFCRQHKIACVAPPVGSADMTCKYVAPL
jgi:F-box-like